MSLLKTMFMNTSDSSNTGLFKTVIWTGDGSSNRTITGVGFQPDLVIIKQRNEERSFQVFDSVRGAGKLIKTDEKDNESTVSSRLKSFNSDGFTIGDNATVNGNNNTYVAWCWKADKAGVTNSNQEESYNANSGLSIIKYEGNGTSGRTVSHSLGKAPKFVWVKCLTTNYNWRAYAEEATEDRALTLDSNVSAYTSSSWNNTAPTSTTVTLGSGSNINDSGKDYIMYAFSVGDDCMEHGEYFGNGSGNAGPSITGKDVACDMIIIKGTGQNVSWAVFDNVRDTTNPVPNRLYLNGNDTEVTTTANQLDFNSDGFEIKSTGGYGTDRDGYRYYYWYWEEK